jgi:hypothetical protein
MKLSLLHLPVCPVSLLNFPGQFFTAFSYTAAAAAAATGEVVAACLQGHWDDQVAIQRSPRL